MSEQIAIWSAIGFIVLLDVLLIRGQAKQIKLQEEKIAKLEAELKQERRNARIAMRHQD